MHPDTSGAPARDDYSSYLHLALGLPLGVAQGLNFSIDHAHCYFVEHMPPSTGLDRYRCAFLAAARLEWLLRSLRKEISGLFSEDDIVILMNCFQADYFFPGSFESLASDLCDDFGIDIGEHKNSEIALLVDKLLGLTAGQRLALADALEQAWHRGSPANLRPAEFLPQLGIELI